MSKLTCSKACDIREQLGIELNTDIAQRIGSALDQFLNPKSITIGDDVHINE
ncbi:phosphomannomutase [Actinobacillus ureae]|uniref:Phosphomannomutase n=1 Tax=Actinobacillus ureae ATCC 25976 TaxID=887324 RepID=E8KGX5_9PAST|nr:hypothetical protein [Actinobacillus ureae]EFX91855.1 phosphomannomutase [Actinobacillus ureae ATCC 25976]SUT86122.1 phosphomannomutase [Actinobacillus ureae]SUU44807.1 phosphomannomutase [Actinobacillus ureae]